MAIRVQLVPYDSGHRDRRMGRGPLHLVGRGAVDRLRSVDPDVAVATFETASAFPTEIGTAFEAHRAVAGGVAEAARAGAFPLVLSGNCNSAVGTVSGLRAAGRPGEPVGVVWLDGHADASTPETFDGDFLDAMGLATLTGRCWQALAVTVPGFRPAADEDVVLVGGHGAGESSRAVLATSAVANVTARDVEGRGVVAALGPALDALARRGVGRVYLHLDADVLDADRVAPANEFAPPGGLLPGHLAAVVDAVAGRFAIGAAAVASFDPGCDRGDRVLAAALGFLERVAARAA